jgi:M6 family metalloprotease-like protein
MNKYPILIICLALSLMGLCAILPAKANAQLWLEFAHPSSPHLYMTNPNVPITVPELFSTSGDVTITRPVLVVLMEFSDMTHRAEHTVDFWRDLFFGNPRPGIRPSVAEIMRENSNGRLLLVPATAGDVYDGNPDGIVGWVASTKTAAELADTNIKRAESIIVADPLFDYHVYDSNGDGLITTDELLIVAIFADNAPLYNGAYACDQHIGHTDQPGCVGVPGGNTRQTNPSQIDVDQDTAWPKKVYEWIAGVGEIARVGVIIHEICHATFGHGDLYAQAGCQIYQQVEDGYICMFCNNCDDECANAVCMEDGLPYNGSTANATGTDITSCAYNDTADVWHTYTPTVSGSVTISLCGSEFDTTLAVFDACGGNEIDCNDDFDCDGDGNTELQSQITLGMTAGITYWIRVAGYNGATGKYRLTVTGGGGSCGYANDYNIWYPPRPGVYTLMDNYVPSEGFVHHLDPWAKIHLGFVKPLVVTHDGTYTLYDAETERNFSSQNTQPEALIVYDPLRTDPYKEYFILENRNITGTPIANQDQGLAVWLINENTLDLRRVVRLIRRGGHFVGDDNALWDGTDDVQGYDLTATSVPRNTNWTDGTKSYIEVYDIPPAGTSMTFKVRMPPIFVDRANGGSETGSRTNPFNTVSEGIAAIPTPPRTIKIAGGSYPEPMVISTPCSLMGWRNGNAVIGE